MHLEQFTPLEEYVQQHWKTFQEVSDYINKDPVLWLEGEGVIYFQTEINGQIFKDAFYLFKINNHLYGTAIKENRETKVKYFDGVSLLNESLLKSSTFREAQQQNFNTKYRELGAQIEIECKPYTHHDEHKLLFSRAEKVDLIYSHILILDNIQETIQFQAKTYPSLKQAVKWQQMANLLHERTNKIIADRKK